MTLLELLGHFKSPVFNIQNFADSLGTSKIDFNQIFECALSDGYLEWVEGKGYSLTKEGCTFEGSFEGEDKVSNDMDMIEEIQSVLSQQSTTPNLRDGLDVDTLPTIDMLEALQSEVTLDYPKSLVEEFHELRARVVSLESGNSPKTSFVQLVEDAVSKGAVEVAAIDSAYFSHLVTIVHQATQFGQGTSERDTEVTKLVQLVEALYYF